MTARSLTKPPRWAWHPSGLDPRFQRLGATAEVIFPLWETRSGESGNTGIPDAIYAVGRINGWRSTGSLPKIPGRFSLIKSSGIYGMPIVPSPYGLAAKGQNNDTYRWYRSGNPIAQSGDIPKWTVGGRTSLIVLATLDTSYDDRYWHLVETNGSGLDVYRFRFETTAPGERPRWEFAGGYNYSAGSVPVDGKPHAVLYRQTTENPGTGRWWIDGTYYTNAANSGSDLSVGEWDTAVQIGTAGTSQRMGSDDLLYMVAHWDFPLTDGEAAMVSADPFGLIRKDESRLDVGWYQSGGPYVWG